jgi:hypothetical protein
MARGGYQVIGTAASNLWKSVTIRLTRPVGEVSERLPPVSLINFAG